MSKKTGCGQLTERGETSTRSAYDAVWAGDGPMRIGGGDYTLKALKRVSVQCLGRGELLKAGISAQALAWANVLYNRLQAALYSMVLGGLGLVAAYTRGWQWRKRHTNNY
jgi:hypothetical protein